MGKSKWHDSPRRAAREAAAAHLERIGRDLEAWMELFDERAIIEFPYAPSLGTPARLEGKAAIRSYMADILPQMKDLAFTDVRITETRDPDVVFVESHGEAHIDASGRHLSRYAQDYVMRLETRDGKIVHYREYWNPLPAVQAFGGAGALRELLQPSSEGAPRA
ncbi:nuclear transport factor 2 family protein [Pendulispora albinea]|uniref:Nuclear transport factor 2 family protein n=1 Tax=Pendulispora albinea TaxID=2741071 RepID=A0ABZ2LVF0_9BACT